MGLGRVYGGVTYTHVGHMKEGLKQGTVVVKRRGLRL